MMHKIALITGGYGPERNVEGAPHYQNTEHVMTAFASLGFHFQIIEFGTIPRFIEELQQYHPDVAYLTVYGKYGEDGCLQGLLDMLQIPYTGSGVLSSALAMNKHACKQAVRIDSPKGILVTTAADLEKKVAAAFPPGLQEGGTLVVKPNAAGSSYGVKFCRLAGDIRGQVESIIPRLGAEALIEEFIPGNEVTIYAMRIGGVLQTFPPIEIIFQPGDEGYTTTSKYGGEQRIAVKLDSPDSPVKEGIIEATRMVYEMLGCKGLARLDYRLKEADDGTHPKFLEINTIPGVRRHHLQGMLNIMGWSYEDLIKRQLDEAAHD